MKVQIKNSEAGFVFRKGKLIRILETGSYRPLISEIRIVSKKKSAEFSGFESVDILSLPEMKKKFTVTVVKNDEIGFHFIDGVFEEILFPGTHTFFNEPFRHEIRIFDTDHAEVPSDVPMSVLREIEKNHPEVIHIDLVKEGTVAACYIDGKYTRLFHAGCYAFFVNSRQVYFRHLSLQQSMLLINGQEILSKDKVTIRFNLTLSYQISDAEKLLSRYEDYEEELRLMMQMAYREYLGGRTLDEILSDKESLGGEVLGYLKQKEADFGMVFLASGIRDVILPGEIRDILNTVLIAEKKAMANVITRREETASTRSLLNTAKLMEENQTLYRLKELEYLERIFDKVQTLSLSSSASAIEQLTALINRK